MKDSELNTKLAKLEGWKYIRRRTTAVEFYTGPYKSRETIIKSKLVGIPPGGRAGDLGFIPAYKTLDDLFRVMKRLDSGKLQRQFVNALLITIRIKLRGNDPFSPLFEISKILINIDVYSIRKAFGKVL